MAGLLDGKVMVAPVRVAEEGSRVSVNASPSRRPNSGRKVRSNCIAPFAMTPMVIAGVPNQTQEDKARWRVIERMKPENIAPFTCALLSDAAADISGQIFGVRANEVYLFSQTRPIRTAHSAEPGWSAETVVERVFPMF